MRNLAREASDDRDKRWKLRVAVRRTPRLAVHVHSPFWEPTHPAAKNRSSAAPGIGNVGLIGLGIEGLELALGFDLL